MSKIKGHVNLIVIVLMTVLLTILVMQNTEIVQVSLLFWDLRTSLVVLIVVSTAIGWGSGLAMGHYFGRRSSRR